MTQNPKIYRINKNHFSLRGIQNANDILKKILTTSLSKFNIDFKIEQLEETIIEDYVYYLYLFNTDEQESDWKQFLPSALTVNHDFTQQKLSLVLFIDTGKNIFCIIGGNAYRLVISFLDQSFGLNTYARIMKPEEDELISIRSRGITGLTAGIQEQYRDDFKLIDFIKFGKVPQEIHIKLNKAKTDEYFDFLDLKKNERIVLEVSKSIKVKRSMSFEEVHQLIKSLDEIMENQPSDYLSSYKEITDSEIIERILYPELINSIYRDSGFIGNSRSNYPRFEFDFCNPNSIEQFYVSDEFVLKEKTENNGYAKFAAVQDRKSIYETVLKHAKNTISNFNQFELMVFLQGVRITCYRDGKKTVASNFLYHISSEFNIDNVPYFLVDTKWYRLRESFIDDLRLNCQHVLRTYKADDNLLSYPWNKDVIRTEGEYNLQYDGLDSYIILDAIIEDGVELCDILKFDDDGINLIHVKYGFKSEIRELTNQIKISAKRLKDALNSDNSSFLERLYLALILKGRSVCSLTKEEFLNLFNKRITYVLAFTSQLSQDLRVEESVDAYKSNIAKYSMVQCSSEMRAYYYNLLTYQIPRE